ncbi:fasciclin domain-containing protein [Plebeiibacterium marinum]|uniref:Fasciclin domain-containing protein n=1 Tax=Plebeiibacterium marinum TaxID=2992111 RepID=A0AAE3MGQ0_9BACT|nr:fasciclin domain-containing protein [Plebeiobacterium marinum]MCW3807523.1 fasciclin domain-containing protein [Plebeiobacterium marinum]
MKNIKQKYMCSHKSVWLAVVMSLSVLFYTACDSDDVGDNYYTFTGDTVGSYIEKNPDEYSELIQLLDQTNVMGLLKGYGMYTCFIPDNDAMARFYESKGRSSLNEFPADTLKKIVYDHIIKGYVIESEDFISGFLPNVTMSGRFLKMSYESNENGLSYVVNTNSVISSGDISVHNGVIHKITEVLAPTENTIVEAIAANEKFSLFYEALAMTGLDQELSLVEDKDYVPDPVMVGLYDGLVNNIGGYNIVPKTRKYGYTALMESDATYAANGITTIDELKQYAKQVYDMVYPEDAGITDVTNRKNSLNRFVAYHLVNKKIPSLYFIEKYDNTGSEYGTTHSVKTYDMYEYIETMCPNTLMEVRTIRTSNEYNVFNMITGTGEAVRLTEDYDNDAINGVYHEIDNILAYKKEFVGELTSKRIRMDVASFFPELANNNIRIGHATSEYPNQLFFFPHGYLERLTASQTTTVMYFNSDDRFKDYQGDEMFLNGMYDFEVVTPAIPAGTYEIRFGYQPTGNRGAAQLYWDGQPTGIPLDLTLRGSDPKIGYEEPGSRESDPFGYENDKMMRNRGYMKGGASYKVINEAWYSATGRNQGNALRKILGIFTLNKDTTHVFGVRAARSGEFMFDFLEFVPIEALEKEGVD